MPTIQFRPNKPQWCTLPWFRQNHVQVWPWGRGVGKTRWHRENWWRSISEWDGKLRENALEPIRGVRIVVLFPWFKQFKDAHASGILDDLHGRWHHLGGHVDKTTWQITFPGGSKITPFPAKEHTLQAARSIRCDIIDADEIDDIPASTYEGVAIPWLSEPWSLHEERLSGTPKLGRHGLLYRLHKLGIDPGEPNFHSLHATYLDSPETVDIRAVERAQKTTSPEVFRREWLCDFDAAEGLVYGDVFDEQFHVREPDAGTVFSYLMIGQDHGYESPGAAYLIGVRGSGDDATAHVLDEEYHRRKTTDEWAVKLKRWTDKYPTRITLYADPSEPKTIEAYRQKAGVKLPPGKVDNNVDDGISAVANLFMRRKREDGSEYARLYISPKCVNLIRELGLYRYRKDPQNADSYLNDVEKRNDHGPDAIRYAIFNGIYRPCGTRRYSDIETRQ
jgi:hypothetical protein